MTMATRLRAARRAARAGGTGEGWETRALLTVAVVPSAGAALVTMALAALLIWSADGAAAQVAPLGAALWLAAHLVPATVNDVTIGVMPLLPAAAMLTVTAWVVARTARADSSPGGVARVVGAAVLGPLLATAIALAVAADSSSLPALGAPAPGLSFLWVAAMSVFGSVAGVGFAHPREVADRIGLADWAREGLRTGVVAAAALFAAGALVTLVRLVLRHAAVSDLVAGGGGVDGGLGLTVLSIAYLPNVAIGALAVLVGADAHVGPVTVGWAGTTEASLPPLPVLAVLEPGASGLGPAVLVVPVAVAAGCGLLAWRRAGSLVPALRVVAAAAGVAAALVVLLGAVASGELGAIGTAGVALPTLGVYTLGLVGAGGALAVIVAGRAELRRDAAPSTRGGTKAGKGAAKRQRAKAADVVLAAEAVTTEFPESDGDASDEVDDEDAPSGVDDRSRGAQDRRGLEDDYDDDLDVDAGSELIVFDYPSDEGDVAHVEYTTSFVPVGGRIDDDDEDLSDLGLR